MTARPAYVYDAALDEWVAIVGPPGPQGPAGPAGPAGTPGAPGADGADGADGTSVGGVPVHIGTVLPTDPVFVWFDTTGGNLQIKYEDGL